MDYITQFDIQLEKEMFYAGELIQGHVILKTNATFKIKAIKATLRGKATAEWKIIVGGESRQMVDEQSFVDERKLLWGNVDGEPPLMNRGSHSFPFKFQLPESSLPCSFESKACTIRYFIRVIIEIPYASSPQGTKYFTIIGPHIDCMDEQYLKPLIGNDERSICCFCCRSSYVRLKVLLERSAYCCGESIRLKAEVDNQGEENVKLKIRLVQYVEYVMERGILDLQKEVVHEVLEYLGDDIRPNRKLRFDSSDSLVVPTMPPTMVGVCKILQLHYVLKVSVMLEKSGAEKLPINFPITIATCPFRIPNSNKQPIIDYDVCCDHVEGGMYIGPEFQMGQVYDGTKCFDEEIVLYRPVYVTVRKCQQSKDDNDNENQFILENNGLQSSIISSNQELNHCEPGPSRCNT